MAKMERAGKAGVGAGDRRKRRGRRKLNSTF
ncbi:unnamed protein product [Onchocerca flexuosa]|uniref:Uncharacterized protein n=1 Tax=Onchocerca flexuosa TaxID=387005 RepID=A0A183HFF9_9BILA|nr:unnamed protein product [Onchocerca flexuosa]